jgi:hypothetical protein
MPYTPPGMNANEYAAAMRDLALSRRRPCTDPKCPEHGEDAPVDEEENEEEEE